MAHRLAPEVEDELADIWHYVASQSGDLDAADRLIDSITERFLLLSTYPHLGRRRDDLRPGLRSFTVAGYVIIYRVEGEDVFILHIVHGRREFQNLFR
jgi:toxin ParE1/3/4